MARKIKEFKVFIASPGDLAPERKMFKETVEELNSGFGEGAGVRFTPLGWENVLAETGRRTQSVINKQIEQCDLFILALHRRWGQSSEDSPASSYTEEEFNLATKLWKKKKTPEVMVFFKSVDTAAVADPGVQLQKVLNFRKKLEDTRSIMIRTFNGDVDFGQMIDEHLRAYARGEWDSIRDIGPAVTFSRGQVAALDKAERKEQRRSASKTATKKASGKGKKVSAAGLKADLSLVNIVETDLTLCRAAVDAAEQGRVQDARILFAKATEGTTDLSILSVAADFFRQVGDPDNATRLALRQVAIARDRRVAARHYMALVPQDHLQKSMQAMLSQMLSNFPVEMAEEMMSIFDEVFGHGQMEELMLENLINHYTESEIVQLARFLASPVGQAQLQKAPMIQAEMMQIGAQRFQAAYLARHPELATSDAIGEGGQGVVLPPA